MMESGEIMTDLEVVYALNVVNSHLRGEMGEGFNSLADFLEQWYQDTESIIRQQKKGDICKLIGLLRPE